MSKKLPPDIYIKLRKVDSIIASLTNPKNKGKLATKSMIDSLMGDLSYVVGELNVLYKQLIDIIYEGKEKD